MMNIYDVMLELSKKVYDRKDGQTYLKIDPNFWVVSNKFEGMNDQPLLYGNIQKTAESKDVGNVTNLFFYTLKYSNFAYMTTMKNYKSILNEIDEIK